MCAHLFLVEVALRGVDVTVVRLKCAADEVLAIVLRAQCGYGIW